MDNKFNSKEYFEHDLEIRYKYNQDACFPDFHFHDSYEVFYSIGGGTQFLIEDNIYSLDPGDLFIINNNEIHKPLRNPNAQYERIVLVVNPDKIKEIAPQQTSLLLSCFTSRRRGEHNKINLSEEERDHFLSLVDKIHSLNSHELGHEILKELYFIELLVHLNRWYRTNYSTTKSYEPHGFNPTIKSIIDYLNDRFTSQINLEQLAEEFHMNKYYICQLFKSITGTTINRYITARRLARAKILLNQGHSVTETSASCGFSNYTHFIRTFKNHFGISPKQYQKNR